MIAPRVETSGIDREKRNADCIEYDEEKEGGRTRLYPVEAWKVMDDKGEEILRSIFTRIMEAERMPDEWREGTLVPIYKNKGDMLDCGNYRGIKLMAYTLKMWERVIERRLRDGVSTSGRPFGVMPRRSTTDAIFALRQLIDKFREGKNDRHCIFIDLEKVATECRSKSHGTA